MASPKTKIAKDTTHGSVGVVVGVVVGGVVVGGIVGVCGRRGGSRVTFYELDGTTCEHMFASGHAFCVVSGAHAKRGKLSHLSDVQHVSINI